MEVHHPDFKPNYAIRFRSSEPDSYDEVSVQMSLDPQFYFTGNATGSPILSPRFRGAAVVKTSNQTLVDATPTTVTWDVATWDTDSFWSGGANTRFTIPAGVSWVRLSGNVNWLAGVSQSQLNFWKNGSNVSFLGASESREGGNGSWGGIWGESAAIPVQAGDYFELRAQHVTGSNTDIIPIQNRSWFAIEVLG